MVTYWPTVVSRSPHLARGQEFVCLADTFSAVCWCSLHRAYTAAFSRFIYWVWKFCARFAAAFCYPRVQRLVFKTSAAPAPIAERRAFGTTASGDWVCTDFVAPPTPYLSTWCQLRGTCSCEGRGCNLTGRPTRTHSSRLPLRGACRVPVASNVRVHEPSR